MVLTLKLQNHTSDLLDENGVNIAIRVDDTDQRKAQFPSFEVDVVVLGLHLVKRSLLDSEHGSHLVWLRTGWG